MPSVNTKRIEESATTALKAALLRCPILDSYIDSNDKTPSWDGTVFVYKSEKTKKENLAGRVPIQIKGTEKVIVSDTATFSCSVADLNNYYKDGGCVFFLISVDLSSGNSRIFYKTLLVVDLDKIIKGAGKQKTSTIHLNLFPTAANEISSIFMEFTDNVHMLNVAVSRAVHSLAVVTSQDPRNDQTNYGDLTRYIEYNNFEVIQSQVYSVFDMLYQGYAEQRRAYLKKHKRISEYDSENLMYSVIQEVLSEEAFSSIGCAVHVSLATLVKNYEPLTEKERKYARNPLTHVDFLLFNQMDKQPVLAIEVDGTGFHEAGSKQAERDMKKNSILEKCAVTLLRLRTDGSGEKEKIKNALKGE